MPVNIRQALPEDLSALRELYNTTVSDGGYTLEMQPKAAAAFKKWFEGRKKERPVLTAEDEGIPVGWVSLEPFSAEYPFDHSAKLRFVLPRRSRSPENMTALLEAIDVQAAGLRLGRVEAELFANDYTALHTFRMAGYRDVGICHGYGFYKGKMQDVSVLERIFLLDEAALKEEYRAKYSFYKKYFDEADRAPAPPDPNKKRRVIE